MATPFADLQPFDPGTELFDDADTLVARDQRQVRLDRPVAVRRMDIGMAQAGCLDTDQHLPTSGHRLGDILDAKVMGEIMDDCCLHFPISFCTSWQSRDVRVASSKVGPPCGWHAGHRKRDRARV